MRHVGTKAFEGTDFQKLEAYHRAENTKSGRVLEKSPMHATDTVERLFEGKCFAP